MMKHYESPEMEISKFSVSDIIQDSEPGIVPSEDAKGASEIQGSKWNSSWE